MIHRGDEDLPYVMMGHLARWLIDLPEESITAEVAARVKAFSDWCEEQTRGKTAADDIFTILVVGLYEELFAAEHTRTLLPKLISKKEFAQSSQYLKKWIGEDYYAKASKHFN